MVYLFFSSILLGIGGYLMATPLAILFSIIFLMSLPLKIETNFKELQEHKYIKELNNEFFIFKFVVSFIFIGILFKIIY